MELEILKLGGSILKGQEDFQRIAGLLETKLEQGILPVCVVSAMKGVTDKIIAAIGAMRTEAGFNPVTFVEALYEEHLPAVPASVSLKELRLEFDKLKDVLSYIRSSGELSESVYAYTVSRGENFTMRILGHHLGERGIAFHCFYGEDLFVTNENNKDAEVNLEKTKIKVEENLVPYLGDGKVAVVAGFAGRSEGGLITIFGRGGTDDTAACIAYCLGVKRMIKYVDEGGIMSLDPKFVAELKANKEITAKVGRIPDPKVIHYLSYVEASELLREERTKVVHFKVLNPLMKGNIRLQLKSLGEEEGEGTIIGIENGFSGPIGRPKAVSFQRNLYGVRFLPSQSALPTEVYARVFEALGKAGVDVRYLSISGYQISLLMVKHDVEIAVRALSGLDFAVEVKPLEERKGTFSVVGSEMRGVKGFLSKITGVIASYGINIEQATQPNSENIIRFSVNDDDLPLAVAAVYAEYWKE
jgi:aspartokinase